MKIPPPTRPRVFVVAAGAALATVAICAVILNRAAPTPADMPITRELQAAAADLDMPPVPDSKTGFLRQAQIIRELAKREKARNVR